MEVFQSKSITRFFAQVLFLLVPTSCVVLFILWNSNQYFSILKDQWLQQTIYFTIGSFIAYFLYQFRLRFLPTFLVLGCILFSIYKVMDNYAVGEFDSFFISIQFLVFAYLFGAGWLCGWGLKRVSFFPIILSGLFLLLSIFLISKTGELTVSKLLQYLSPIVLFSIYIIYTHEALKNTEKTDGTFWWKFSTRLILFCSLLLLIFGTILFFMFGEIKARVAEFGGQSKEGENQMLQNNKDGTVENKESMGMSANNNRNKIPEPLFCAHIDSYLPGSEIPNPLYLTSYHFTKFDTLTETFERDSNFVFNDEFQPNPSTIPLYSTLTDSSRIRNSFSSKNRKTVNIEIYKKRLSMSAFIAPSTAFWVQPITIEKDFQKEFSSAYRSKSYVSDLNSAYFIYNTDNPQVVEFQKQRFLELRKAKSYETVDRTFYNYYTFFPKANQYQKIKTLADSLSQGKTTTIDKVLSIRDYFLQRNALGEKVFSYSDNPGVPGLPGSSKLMYFMFESKKGYCAYYAGASLFLLRAMGIPSRIVTGFLTVDRSDKNTGWYWFYEDQSHGWVQVYFPEYGWIDFDTTVGNDDAEHSPTPDGTPPLQPPNPLLAVSGTISAVDTLKKTANVHISNLLFKDQEYKKINEDIVLDLKIARIWKDSVQVTLANLIKGNDVMAISYAEKLKGYSPEKTAKELVAKIMSPVPTDEVYIKDYSKNNKPLNQKKEQEDANPFSYYLTWILGISVFLLLLILAIPTLVYQFYKFKLHQAKDSKRQAYYTYKASTFLLNQLKIERNGKTPWQFAQQIVDNQFNTHFSSFMNVYLKLKFANQHLNESEKNVIQHFFKPFEATLNQQIKFGTRILHFLNLNTFIRYYTLPEPETNIS